MQAAHLGFDGRKELGTKGGHCDLLQLRCSACSRLGFFDDTSPLCLEDGGDLASDKVGSEARGEGARLKVKVRMRV